MYSFIFSSISKVLIQNTHPMFIRVQIIFLIMIIIIIIEVRVRENYLKEKKNTFKRTEWKINLSSICNLLNVFKCNKKMLQRKQWWSECKHKNTTKTRECCIALLFFLELNRYRVWNNKNSVLHKNNSTVHSVF